VRLRAYGQLTELRGDDLRFTLEEARALLNDRLGLDLGTEDLVALDERIEGWIAGLQLAAISMQRLDDHGSFVTSLSNSPYYVMEFLTEEVLRGLPGDVRAFLMRTSILGRMCASLCDRVTGHQDGAAMLAYLYRSNVFVTPLDPEHAWFRYHQLFADHLQGHLRRHLDGEGIAHLHRQAGLWHAEHGNLRRAVEHALAAGDLASAADLAERAADASTLDSWMTDLLSWLDTLPPAVVRARLRLRIYYACALFFDGQTDRCAAILDECRQAVDNPAVGVEGDALRSELATLIEIAYAYVDSLELSMRGDLRRSLQVLGRAGHLAESVDNAFLLAHALEGQGLNQYHLGQLCAAAATSERLVALATTSAVAIGRDEPLPVASAGYLLLAAIDLDQNDLDSAMRNALQALQLVRGTGGAKSLVEAYVMCSRVLLAQDDLNGAASALSRAEVAYGLEASTVTRFRLEMQRARLNLAVGSLDEATHWARGLATVGRSGGLPPLFREVLQLLLARVDLIRGDPIPALERIDCVLPGADRSGRARHVIEALTLQALGWLALGHGQEASVSMDRALALAQPEGFVRVFVEGADIDTGSPMRQLLHEAADRAGASRFAGVLLKAYPGPCRASASANSALLEPLSEREIEVIEALALGLTNQEIAQRLTIALNTVKTHTGRIYGKLGVANRTQAVTKARVLGLIQS
jgi:LuxR family maltose regulon positive regulatory protein